MSADLTQVEAVVLEAYVEAAKATRAYLAAHGDRDACGFAWVEIYGIKGNTKLGKAFKAAGLEKNYNGAFSIWNPSGHGAQNIDTKFEGALAAQKVFEKHGFKRVFAASRLD